MQVGYRLRSLAAKLGIRVLQASGIYGSYFAQWRNDLFNYAEKRGLHILPVHYYTPIPTREDFARTRRKNGMAGIAMNIDAGAQIANKLIEKYRADLDFLRGNAHYDPANQAIHPLDAALLYAYVRDAKPKRIIEIGSGISTSIIAKAIRDERCHTMFSCIEPYLPDYLRPKPIGVSEIIETPLQLVSIDRFKELEPGDILFIDSTHVVRYDSDVVYEILEILPALQPGVIIHVHDIFLPDDYPEDWLKKRRFFWNEQYMLQALLSMNPCFQIEIPVHAIRHRLSTEAQDVIYSNSSAYATSFWMRKPRPNREFGTEPICSCSNGESPRGP